MNSTESWKVIRVSEEGSLGTLLQSSTGSVAMMVKTIRGEGRFSHWLFPEEFEVIASRKRKRFGHPAMGQFLADYPRVRTSKPYYRFVRLGGFK